MSKTILTQELQFSDDHQALAVFPSVQAELPKVIESLGLATPGPVVILIGGAALVEARQGAIIEQSIRVVAKVAEQTQAMIVSGGTDSGIMATIGQVRARGKHRFPLIGISPESRVSWPNGPRDRPFLWWRKKRWPLEPHYTHFMLVPGEQFGAESPWIVEAATQLSGEYPSVTILVNGGNISRQDIALSLAADRPVIVLAGTGRLADELAGKPSLPGLMTIVSADDENTLFYTIRIMLTQEKP